MLGIRIGVSFIGPLSSISPFINDVAYSMHLYGVHGLTYMPYYVPKSVPPAQELMEDIMEHN